MITIPKFESGKYGNPARWVIENEGKLDIRIFWWITKEELGDKGDFKVIKNEK